LTAQLPVGFAASRHDIRRKEKMLMSVSVILVILWILGLVTSYTLGGFIHILLVVAVVLVLVRIIRGRRLL
jgi:uncharacterized membrane protein